eukprot:TRINITY_DN14991_c0_g1_i8.p1 TRINITY_DN14991_c0_g1~~TRINITY_DN14991_c0_g1_i8.p1  ORF type:complete len:445 (+),score=146.55 TRINITY_DN14991_c0_g1_i8:994-2328(+)
MKCHNPKEINYQNSAAYPVSIKQDQSFDWATPQPPNAETSAAPAEVELGRPRTEVTTELQQSPGHNTILQLCRMDSLEGAFLKQNQATGLGGVPRNNSLPRGLTFALSRGNSLLLTNNEQAPAPAAAAAAESPLGLNRKNSSLGSDECLRQISIGDFLSTNEFSLHILRPDASPDSEPDLRDELHQLVVKGDEAAHVEAVRAALHKYEEETRKEVVNQRSQGLKTPLDLALMNGLQGMALLLLHNGADPWLVPHCVHLATQLHGSRVLQIMLEQRPAEATGTHMDGLLPVHIAAKLGRHESLAALLSSQTEPAARASMVMAATQTDSKETALHLAGTQGCVLCMRCVIEHSKEAVHCTDSQERTPLHNAAASGCVQGVELLLACGADLRKQDADLLTAAHFAFQNGHTELSKKLMEKSVSAAPSPLKPLPERRSTRAKSARNLD